MWQSWQSCKLPCAYQFYSSKSFTCPHRVLLIPNPGHVAGFSARVSDLQCPKDLCAQSSSPVVHPCTTSWEQKTALSPRWKRFFYSLDSLFSVSASKMKLWLFISHSLGVGCSVVPPHAPMRALAVLQDQTMIDGNYRTQQEHCVALTPNYTRPTLLDFSLSSNEFPANLPQTDKIPKKSELPMLVQERNRKDLGNTFHQLNRNRGIQ